MIELSRKVKDICAKNYKNNCGNCEIRTACVSNANGKPDEWVNRVNELAERMV